MVKQVGYNWNNEFVKCSEDAGCFYKSGKCFNPQHMNVKDYERHFKAKMSLRTVKKFKKTIEHYLPGDNVLYAIIEQTKFFKKSETEMIVKKWEENWMSGAWAEAIAKADEIMVKQEYHSLVKIMLNYVRLFIHSEAKYATQDYVKAVMLQEYVGDVFTEEHFKTLTSPWLSGKNAEEAHFWKYSHRHLSVSTEPLTDVVDMLDKSYSDEEKVLSSLETTQPIFESEDDFVKMLNTTGETPKWEETFWNPEKLVEQEPEKVEEEAIMKETILNKISKPINKVADYLGYNVSYGNMQENIIVEHDVLYREQTFTTEEIVLPNFYTKKEKTVTDLVKDVVEKQSEMLEEKPTTMGAVFNDFVKPEENITVVEKYDTDENISFEDDGVSSETNADESKLEEVPEHLRDFIKTIYFR